MFELGEDLFDRVQVRAVGRQKDQMGSPGPDGGARGLALVAAQIVEHDDVAGLQGWGQNFLDIDPEQLAVDRPVDHPGRVDAVVTQGGDEGLGLPVAEGGVGLQPTTARTPSSEWGHVGLDPGLVQKHQPGRVDPALIRLPARAFTRHVRPRLLLGQQGFF